MKILLAVLLILAIYVPYTYQSSSSSGRTYRPPCSRANEVRVPCYTGGTSESTCPGVYRTGCSTSSYEGYGRRPCGCRAGTYRRSDGACVLYEDCTPEGKITKEQRNDMDTVLKLLNGQSRLILYYDVNGYAKRPGICWSSIKLYTVVTGGIRHKLTYVDTSVQKNGNPTANGGKMETRDLDWYVKARYGVPTVYFHAWNGEKKDISLSGTYTLFAAEPTCFVIGTLLAQKASSSCLYWMDFGSLKQNHTKCEDTFLNKCKDIPGPWYNYTSSNCSLSH